MAFWRDARLTKALGFGKGNMGLLNRQEVKVTPTVLAIRILLSGCEVTWMLPGLLLQIQDWSFWIKNSGYAGEYTDVAASIGGVLGNDRNAMKWWNWTWSPTSTLQKAGVKKSIRPLLIVTHLLCIFMLHLWEIIAQERKLFIHIIWTSWAFIMSILS